METGRGADSIRMYLTGAVSDGGAQADPAAALGGYRSASEWPSLGVELSRPGVRGVTVEAVGGSCTTGQAHLVASGPSALMFTAPGGSAGSAVTIAHGETQILTDGTDPDAICRVTRNTAADLTGSAALGVLARFGALLDVVTAAEAAAGSTIYRAVMIQNVGDYPIADLKIWLDGDTDDLAIAVEWPTSGAMQTIASETTAPTAVSFVAPDAVDHPDVISLAGLYAGQTLGLWLRRTLAASTAAAARVDYQLHSQFTAMT